MDSKELKNHFLRHFIQHADKKRMALWAMEAGYDTAKDMTKEELSSLWHSLLKHK